MDSVTGPNTRHKQRSVHGIISVLETTFEKSESEVTLEFHHVDAKVATEVLEYFDEHPIKPRLSYYHPEQVLRVLIGPSYTHQEADQWIFQSVYDACYKNILSGEQVESLSMYGNVKHTPPGNLSAIAPDFCIRFRTSKDPHIVFEMGWSESLLQLQRDKETWFLFPTTKIVILIKWFPDETTHLCHGLFEVYKRHGDGDNCLVQTEPIWPAPDPNSSTPQAIQITKAELLDDSSVQNPSSIVSFDIDQLRETVMARMKFDGYSPKLK